MKNEEKQRHLSRLRKRAEMALSSVAGLDIAPELLQDVERLINELQTHQVELEIQNEELRHAQAQLAIEREKFADLYKFAPVAYFTLNSNDVIVELNPAASELLRQKSKYLLGRPITPYLTPESLQTYFQHRMFALETNQPQVCELTIRLRNRVQVIVEARTVALAPSHGQERLWRTVMTDITLRKHAEKQLMQTSERLALATRSAMLGIWDWDIQKNELVWDNQMYVLYGLVPGQFGGAYDAWMRCVHPDDRQASDQISAQAVRGEREYDTEFRVLWPDGSIHWLKATGQVFRDANGLPLRMVGVNYDITPSKQSQAALYESEQRLYNMIDSAMDAIITTNQADEIILFNDAAEKMFGITSSQALGQMLRRFVPNGFQAVQHPLANRLEAEATVSAVQHTRVFSAMGLRTNGDEFPMEASISYSESKGQQLVTAILRDVTTRKKAEEALLDSESRFRSFFETNAAVMLTIEPVTGQIMDANPAASAFYGYSLEEFKRMNISHINQMPPDEVRAERLKAQREERNYFVFPHRLANGSLRTVEVHSYPIKTRGQVLLFSMIYDITDRRKVEAQLQLEQEKLSQIAFAVPGVIYSFRLAPNGVTSAPYVSPASWEFIGLASEQMSKDMSPFFERIHPDDWAGFMASITQSAQEMTVWHHEFRYQHPGKGLIWLEGKSVPGCETDGSILWHGFLTEVTGRKQTDELVYAQRDLARVIGKVDSLQAGLQGCFAAAQRVSGLDCGGIYLYDEERGVFELAYHQGLSPAFSQAVLLYQEKSPEIEQLLGGSSLHFSADQVSQIEQYRDEGLKIVSVVPIIYQNKVIGFLNIASHTHSYVPDFVRHALETIAIEIGNFVVYMRSELSVRRSEATLSRAQAIAHVGSWTAHLPSENVECSAELYRIFGLPQGKKISIDVFFACVHPDDFERTAIAWKTALKNGVFDVDHRIILENGQVRWIHELAEVTFAPQGQPLRVTGSAQDITDAKLEENYLQARLRLANISSTEPELDPLIRAMLDEAEALTDSKIGFFHFIEDGQNVISLQTWSTNTLAGMCAVGGKDGMHYPLDEAGVWADSIRTDTTVVYNDYLALPNRKGLPNGHAPITRLVTLPIRRGNQIVAVVGMGNKPRDYDAYDLGLLHRLTEETFDLILRKRTEAFLRQSEEKYRRLSAELEERVKERTAEIQDLYDKAPTGYHSLDANGNIVLINQTELNRLGYTRQEVLGRSILGFVSPPTSEIFQRVFPEFKRTGVVRDLEIEFVRKDGSRYPGLLNATAVYDAAGNYVMSRSSVFDISERKQVENALRASEETYRALFETANDAIFLLDIKSRAYLRVNPRCPELLGVATAEELIGRTANEFMVTSQHRDADTQMQSLLLGERLAPYERTFRRRNGTFVDTEINLSLIRDEYGQPKFIQSVVRDITQRKHAEQAIRESEAQLRLSRDQLSAANATLEKAARLKDEFLAGMSHELRTPLTGILGLSEALQMKIYGDMTEKQAKAINHIESSGRHLLDLINDVLDLSKIEAGMFELQIEMCALADICQASLQLTKGMANKKQQRVSYTIEPAQVFIHVDVRRMKQVLVNLLSNAIKFTPDGGSIGLQVAANEAEGIVNITVWDNGIGIAPENIQRLFKPFVQLDSSLAREQTGTGLGLSLVHRLVDMHGGSIHLESTLGKGSRFTVTLPWQFQNSQVSKPEIPKLPAPPKTPVMEDDQIDLEQLTRFLHNLGIENIVHSGGLEAVEAASFTRPGVILLDLSDASGLELLTSLKADERTAKTPVVVCSRDDCRARALELGAAGYLPKPWSLLNLRTEINRVVASPESLKLMLTISSDYSIPVIMVVDDNEVALQTIADVLQAHRFKVKVAHSGMEFLSQVSEIQPNLILMDIQMPGMDGLETTRRLRAYTNPLMAQIPIIAVTALAMPGDRERCLKAGANEYLSKPVRFAQLMEMVQRLLHPR